MCCTLFGVLTSIIVKACNIVNIQCKVTDYFSFFSKELRRHSTSLRQNGSVMHGAWHGCEWDSVRAAHDSFSDYRPGYILVLINQSDYSCITGWLQLCERPAPPCFCRIVCRDHRPRPPSLIAYFLALDYKIQRLEQCLCKYNFLFFVGDCLTVRI